MPDFEKGVEGAVQGAAVGTSAAVAAGAIAGLIAGSAAGPFGPIVGPIAAGVGAVIGFLVGLFKQKKKTPEEQAAELAAAQKAHAQAKAKAVEALANLNNPAYPNRALPLQTLMGFLDKKSKERLVAGWKRLAGLPDGMDAQAWLAFPEVRQALRDDLAKQGIVLNDAQIAAGLEQAQQAAAAAATPRRGLPGLPIRRRSVGLRSGGRLAVDTRAFSKTIAPYGVGSFKLFPNAAPADWMRGDDTRGIALTGPWPLGLDQDRFALPRTQSAPQPASSGQATSIPAPVAGLGLLGLLWWLI
jgi:hypothetical protein